MEKVAADSSPQERRKKKNKEKKNEREEREDEDIQWRATVNSNHLIADPAAAL